MYCMYVVLQFNRKEPCGCRFSAVLHKICQMTGPPPPEIVNRATKRVITIVTGFGAGETRTATAHNGTVPLHIAAHKGSMSCVLALLKSRAAPLQVRVRDRAQRDTQNVTAIRGSRRLFM